MRNENDLVFPFAQNLPCTYALEVLADSVATAFETSKRNKDRSQVSLFFCPSFLEPQIAPTPIATATLTVTTPPNHIIRLRLAAALLFFSACGVDRSPPLLASSRESTEQAK
mmetsp:Transcript_41484/g.125671  ORF Transcript_41484/g.125671 Transcript_41484/m.125671 type:complete len:112 (+) Transcript_41484:80-415(+)